MNHIQIKKIVNSLEFERWQLASVGSLTFTTNKQHVFYYKTFSFAFKDKSFSGSRMSIKSAFRLIWIYFLILLKSY